MNDTRNTEQFTEFAAVPEADWFHVECDDPDYSGFFQSLADAEALISERGGEISALFEGPMPMSAQQVITLSRTLIDLLKVIPVPRSKAAQAPYQAALLLASQIEAKSDFEPT